jgi:hypothetical protein
MHGLPAAENGTHDKEPSAAVTIPMHSGGLRHNWPIAFLLSAVWPTSLAHPHTPTVPAQPIADGPANSTLVRLCMPQHIAQECTQHDQLPPQNQHKDDTMKGQGLIPLPCNGCGYGAYQTKHIGVQDTPGGC